MPTYKYKCDDCSHEFEVLQKISDTPVTICEECSGGHVRRLLFASAFALKGSGWYQTDYAAGKSSSPGSGNSDVSVTQGSNENIKSNDSLKITKTGSSDNAGNSVVSANSEKTVSSISNNAY